MNADVMSESDHIDMRRAKYETHMKWLKDPRFVKELEGDNIESDVIEEELSTLKHLENPLTQREKVVKFLRSNPIQIILCIFVLLDASIVVAQILLDINSVKERLYIKDKEFLKLWTFLRDEFGEAVPEMRKHHSRPHRSLTRLQTKDPPTTPQQKQTISNHLNPQAPNHHRLISRSLLSANEQDAEMSGQERTEMFGEENNLEGSFPLGRLNLASNGDINKSDSILGQFLSFLQPDRIPRKSTPFLISIDPRTSSNLWNIDHVSPPSRPSDRTENNNNNNNNTQITTTTSSTSKQTFNQSMFTSSSKPSQLLLNSTRISFYGNNGPNEDSNGPGLNATRKELSGSIEMPDVVRNSRAGSNLSDEDRLPLRNRRFSGSQDKQDDSSAEDINDKDSEVSRKVDAFKRAAHILHRISIAILAFLVFEDLVRLLALGRSICHHKIEIFDAILICASFAVGVFYLGGVTGDDGQQAVVALFVLLVWRVARAVDGIIMTVKQRQEFRIRLQRRVRRKAEKMLEAAESEKTTEVQHLEALQELCLKAGIKQEDILSICNLKGQKRLSWMLHALSTVARLSVGMSIFPSFGLYRHVSDWCLNVSPNKKYSRAVQQSKTRLTSPLNLPQSSEPRRISSCSTQEASSSYLGLPQKYFTNQELSSYGNRRLSDVLTTVSDTSEYLNEPKIEQHGFVNKLQMMNLQVAYDNNISSVESLAQVNLSGSNCDNRKRSNGSRKMKNKVSDSNKSHRKKSFKLKHVFKSHLKAKETLKPKKETLFLESRGNSASQLNDNEKPKI